MNPPEPSPQLKEMYRQNVQLSLHTLQGWQVEEQVTAILLEATKRNQLVSFTKEVGGKPVMVFGTLRVSFPEKKDISEKT